MHILQLPAELQAEVLFNLAWYEHFVAAQVCQKWASILTAKKFQRKRHVYDKIEPDVPHGSPTNWRFQRYLPHDEGPPWGLRSGGELSLHGLLWSETLIMFLRREKGEVKVRLLVTADATGYLNQPKGLGVLKQFHEKRYGVRSLYDITDSPLLDSDKIYFWGERTEPASDPQTQSTKKRLSIKRPSFLNSIMRPPATSDDSEDENKKKSKKEPEKIIPISKRLPTGNPIVRCKPPASIYQLNSRRLAQYRALTGDRKGFPLREYPYWTTNDFEKIKGEDLPVGQKYYPGSTGDSLKEFLSTVGKRLKKRLFEEERSTLGCWCVFDIEHRYITTYDQHSINIPLRDPRSDILIHTTILGSSEKQGKKVFSTVTEGARD
ncbi:hypothetical protein TWF481_009823 [Arthrobotrys musiformis]|uniref:F-box domain-containing protein n=1 Tax=Arthrobotrys musiformis TaxID=47236 RepID=A0AAV9W4Y4_9PEZI